MGTVYATMAGLSAVLEVQVLLMPEHAGLACIDFCEATDYATLPCIHEVVLCATA